MTGMQLIEFVNSLIPIAIALFIGGVGMAVVVLVKGGRDER